MEIDLGGRDPNYVCAGCLGDLVVVGESDGRKDYNCKKCGQNRLRECTVCHLPRSVWGDDGNICGGCTLDAMAGKITLNAEQIAGIKKWEVNLVVRVEEHICEQCGTKGGICPQITPHFKCQNCGYERNFIFRRELVDLNDPVEGKLVLKVAGESIK